MSAVEKLILSEPDTLPAEGRKKHDQYFSPQALAHAAVGWLVRDGYLWPQSTILEPSAGKGSWIEALRPLEPAFLTAIDIDPERVADLNARFPQEGWPNLDVQQGDFGAMDWSCAAPYDGVIGNPPFSEAEKHVRVALGLRSRFGVVAFLLRLAFLESEKRIGFWKQHPASKIYVLSERPSFSGLGGSTDNAAYSVIVWDARHRGPTELDVCSWKQPPAILSPASNP